MMGQYPETSLKLDSYVMVILIVHSKSVILIILSLQLEYYELYCLDLGDYFLFARVEILNLPNKFLFVNNSFYHNNWRCLPTQLLSYHTTIRLKRAFVVVLFRARRLKVWAINMLAKSTAKLSDLLARFNVNICVNGEASPKKALKFRDIYSWSNSNIIGLRIPSYSQSFFSLQVVGPFPAVVLEDST